MTTGIRNALASRRKNRVAMTAITQSGTAVLSAVDERVSPTGRARPKTVPLGMADQLAIKKPRQRA
jgi:hypothetical protein